MSDQHTAGDRAPEQADSARTRIQRQKMDAEVWAGVIPLRIAAGKPVSSPDLKSGVDVPGYIRDYRPRS